MEELKNLQQMYSLAAGRFNQYDGKDFVLPDAFKEQVKEINNNSITYNKYSAIIETRGNQYGVLNIFLPNQWFYIASYFTDFYNELQKYKKEALKVTSKERLKNLDGARLSDAEMAQVKRLSIDETSKKYLVQFMTDYSWWCGAKTIDRGDFYVSPILNSARLVNASQSFVADLCAFLADKKELVDIIISGEESESKNEKKNLQQIFYGAPGTGKSNTIKCEVDQKNLPRVRTTFHPDSDYSTFVGAYKPTSVEVPVMTMIGTKAVQAENPDGTPRKEKKIVYEFVPQAFLKAYTGAWKNQDKPFFLIIEEINRGNCAQIFGDLFQLLDRNDEGESDYPISPDDDIQKFLLTDKKYGFAALSDEQKDAIPEEVRSGELMKLPKNLYIWATMNTSDQSLFPIDSAFKRRWDWQYMPISDGKKDWQIEANGKRYDWWDFLQKMNDKIGSTTNSEDKKLGYFFCKTKNGVINAETFVGKVVFYIWNDVFKDFAEEAGDLFKDDDSTLLSFNKFYTVGVDGKAKVVEEKVERLLQNLGIIPVEEIANKDEDFISDENSEDANGNPKNFDKYSVNGNGNYSKGMAVYRCVELYVEQNKDLSSDEIVNAWLSLRINMPNLIETSEMHAERKLKTTDSKFDEKSKELILPNGEKIYVSNQFNPERINDFISKVNSQNWGIHIEKTEE